MFPCQRCRVHMTSVNIWRRGGRVVRNFHRKPGINPAACSGRSIVFAVSLASRGKTRVKRTARNRSELPRYYTKYCNSEIAACKNETRQGFPERRSGASRDPRNPASRRRPDDSAREILDTPAKRSLSRPL